MERNDDSYGDPAAKADLAEAFETNAAAEAMPKPVARAPRTITRKTRILQLVREALLPVLDYETAMQTTGTVGEGITVVAKQGTSGISVNVSFHVTATK